MRTLNLSFIAACILLSVPGVAGAQEMALAPISLDELEQLALKHNPTVAQAAAGVDAARGRARQVGQFPNPIVGYTGEEIRPGGVFRGGEHGIFVQQTIPLGGKLGLSRKIFNREVTRAEALADLQRQRVLNTVRMRFYDALGARRRVDVRERLSQLAAEAVTVSQQLYNVGAADRPDVLESEIEARRASLALNEARNLEFASWRRLAAAVGDAGLEPRPLEGRLDGPLPNLERREVRDALLRDSPEVKAVRAGIERSELAVRRARREPVPDLFVRGGSLYNRELLESGPRGPRPVGWEATAEIGVSVPLFNRNQGGTAAATATLAQSRSELPRLQLDLEQRLADAFEEYLSALRSAEVYRDEVVPRAEEAYQLYLARYRDMAAAYPQVLIAQRTLFQTTEQYVSALERTWRAAVQLQGFLVTDGLMADGARGQHEPEPGETEMNHD